MATVKPRPAVKVKPKPKPKPKPAAKPKPKPVVKPDKGPAGPVTPASTADHSTLDLAAMADNQGGAPSDVTQVSTEGGPGQESAVFSTGPSSAEMLHYQQATTYQQVYADQQASAGSGQ